MLEEITLKLKEMNEKEMRKMADEIGVSIHCLKSIRWRRVKDIKLSTAEAISAYFK